MLPIEKKKFEEKFIYDLILYSNNNFPLREIIKIKKDEFKIS
jgi:hypothetical protein